MSHWRVIAIVQAVVDVWNPALWRFGWLCNFLHWCKLKRYQRHCVTMGKADYSHRKWLYPLRSNPVAKSRIDGGMSIMTSWVSGSQFVGKWASMAGELPDRVQKWWPCRCWCHWIMACLWLVGQKGGFITETKCRGVVLLWTWPIYTLLSCFYKLSRKRPEPGWMKLSWSFLSSKYLNPDSMYTWHVCQH